MEILAPAAVGAFAVIPAIVALYFLKARGPQAKMAGLFLWPPHLADRQANAPWKRLRGSWLLLVQLLVAAALVTALMRPGVVGAAPAESTTVVLLDGSPSMRATDVAPSRFDAAVSRAGRLADDASERRQVAVIVLGRHPQLLASVTGERGVLKAALSRARPGGEPANLQEGLSLANALLAGRPRGSVILFSDGHLSRSPTPPRSSAPVTYESVGTSADNVALEDLGRTPGGDVFLRLANHGPAAEDRRIELRADGRLVDVIPARVDPGSSTERLWAGLPAGARLLEARLTPTDNFAVDDAAWLVTDKPGRRRVLLVTAGNGFLTRALSLRPDLDVTVTRPVDYKPGQYELSIFDGFVPETPLPAPALVVAPPAGKGPVAAGAPIDPGGLLPASPREPLLQYVSLRDVHVQSASIVQVPPDWRTVISAANGPLLLVHKGEPRLAQLNFDLHASDLPLRPAFPILVQNLVAHLLPGGFENQVLPLGEPAQLVAREGTTSMEVRTPGGRIISLGRPFPATLADTSRPGVYTVREAGSGGAVTSRFVVQLQDQRQSDIAPGEMPEVRVGGQPLASPPRGTREVWPWLVALAMVGLAVEWTLFHRG